METLAGALQAVNENVLTCGGDEERRLMQAMRSFSSSFGRPQRKAMLRRQCGNLDTQGALRGKLKLKWFAQAVETCVREACIEVHSPLETERLLDYFFPHPDTNEVSYEELIDVVCARDLQKAKALRQRMVNSGASPVEWADCYGNADDDEDHARWKTQSHFH